MAISTNSSGSTLRDRAIAGPAPDVPSDGGNAAKGGTPTSSGGGGSGDITMTELGWINVKDHGAVGDGATDDRTAIDAAVAAMTDDSVLYFPPGVYLGDVAISNLTGITIKGEGKGVSTLRNTGTSAVSDGTYDHPATTGGRVLDVDEDCVFVTICGMTFDGNCVYRKPGQQAVVVDADYCSFYDNEVINSGEFAFQFGGGRDLSTDPMIGLNCHHNLVGNNYADGINTKNLLHAVISNNMILGCDDDIIACSESQDVLISNNICRARRDVMTIGVTAGGTGYTTAPTVTLTGAPAGVAATAVVTGGIVRLVLITTSGTGHTDAVAAAITVGFTGGGGSGATATIAISAWGRGIAILADTKQIMVESNVISQVKQSGIIVVKESGGRPEQIQLRGNMITGDVGYYSGYGIRITGADNVTCSENVIDDIKSVVGIYIGDFSSVAIIGGSIRETDTAFYRGVAIDETASGTNWIGLTIANTSIEIPNGGNEAIYLTPGGSQGSLTMEDVLISGVLSNTNSSTWLSYNQLKASSTNKCGNNIAMGGTTISHGATGPTFTTFNNN